MMTEAVNTRSNKQTELKTDVVIIGPAGSRLASLPSAES
jgi:hypothetical protein